MKYETPELTALTSAINAIQTAGSKSNTSPYDSSVDQRESSSAYQDWE